MLKKNNKLANKKGRKEKKGKGKWENIVNIYIYIYKERKKERERERERNGEHTRTFPVRRDPPKYKITTHDAPGRISWSILYYSEVRSYHLENADDNFTYRTSIANISPWKRVSQKVVWLECCDPEMPPLLKNALLETKNNRTGLTRHLTVSWPNSETELRAIKRRICGVELGGTSSPTVHHFAAILKPLSCPSSTRQWDCSWPPLPFYHRRTLCQ